MGKRTRADEFEKIMHFINARDFFWIRDLRELMNIENTLVKKAENAVIEQALTMLKENNKVQCCEKRGAERQYIVITKIYITDFYK